MFGLRSSCWFACAVLLLAACGSDPGGATSPGNPEGAVSPDNAKGRYPLTAMAENGVLALSPAGGNYDAGTAVTVIATPKAGYAFSGWSGACTGVGACVVTMDAAKQVVAKFSLAVSSPDSFPWNPSIDYGSLTDARDGQVYKTVRIGAQTWMAENMNYGGTKGTLGSCYDNQASNCATYGRLYNWDDALLGGLRTYTKGPSGIQGVCPADWHVPTDSEWVAMMTFLEADPRVGADRAGLALKSTSGWKPYLDSMCNGEDLFGFRALPGGDWTPAYRFRGLGTFGYWQTATDNGKQGGTYEAFFRHLMNETQCLYRSSQSRNDRYSVRCVKNAL